jgi:Protein of unknown function (DUF2917)
MNQHQTSLPSSASLRAETITVWASQVAGWRVAVPSVLQVTQGKVLITRGRDRDEHLLAHGECITLARGDRLVVEALEAGAPVQLEWRLLERPGFVRGLLRALGAEPAADAVLAFADGLAERARNAASRAHFAQGPAIAGDSMASGGIVQ